MEKILTSLLASFVAPQNLDQAIVNTLGEIGRHMALSRGYIMTVRPNEDVLDNTCEWCAPGISPRKDQLRGIPLDSLPEWMEPLKKNQNIIYSKAASSGCAQDDYLHQPTCQRNNGPEKKSDSSPCSPSAFGASEIQALFITPMWADGRLCGFIGFEDMSGPRDWRREDIQSLQIVAKISSLFANGSKDRRELRASGCEKKQVTSDQLSDGVGGAQSHLPCICEEKQVISDQLAVISENGENRRLQGRVTDPCHSSKTDNSSPAQNPQPATRNPEEDLRKTKNQLESVFNCIADPLNIQDRSLAILMCNPARASLYNMHVQDIIGKKCYEVFQNRTEPCLSCAVIDAFQTGRASYRLRYREGNELAASWAEIFAFPVRNEQGEVMQVVEFARDITQRKQAEDEIRKLYAELEQKVDERTKELQKIQEELVHKEKLAVIGQLIGSVGHEFRSSLTILSGILYLLNNRGDSENIEEFIDTLEEEIHKMSKFVEDLLDFSRTTAPAFQSVDLERVIQKLLQKIDVPSQIQVFIDCPKDLPNAYVDPDHAEQIFHNIISNAIQAMHTGGTLRIRGTREGSKIVLSFTDTGSGISPINIRKIFTPLFTTKAKGTGLGLSIVNMLIKKNKGAVRVESVPTQGTTFTLYFQTNPDPEKEMC